MLQQVPCVSLGRLPEQVESCARTCQRLHYPRLSGFSFHLAPEKEPPHKESSRVKSLASHWLEQYPQMRRITSRVCLRAGACASVQGGGAAEMGTHLAVEKRCFPAGHSTRGASHAFWGLEHLKIIKRKRFELKFMVEPARLGGAG